MADPAPQQSDGAGDLEAQRAQIDGIDRDLIALLSKRAECARRIGAAKALKGGAVFVPHREQEVFKRIAALNPGPLPDQALRAIWREVMSASFALEQPLTICHFGQPGAFTHLAARLKFGESVSYAPVEGISTVFSEVERRH